MKKNNKTTFLSKDFLSVIYILILSLIGLSISIIIEDIYCETFDLKFIGMIFTLVSLVVSAKIFHKKLKHKQGKSKELQE